MNRARNLVDVLPASTLGADGGDFYFSFGDDGFGGHLGRNDSIACFIVIFFIFPVLARDDHNSNLVSY